MIDPFVLAFWFSIGVAVFATIGAVVAAYLDWKCRDRIRGNRERMARGIGLPPEAWH